MRGQTIKGKKIDGSKFELIINDWYSLKELVLQEQQLVEVDLQNIVYANNLENINLSKNQLSELDTPFLIFCRKLVSFDVSDNCLKRVNLRTLRDNQAEPIFLKKINLSNNSLSTLDLNAFAKCINLEYLNLKNNNFSSLDLSPLICCKNLVELQIDSNTKIEWRNTNLNIESLSKGLKKFIPEIKYAWEEYLKELESFKKKEPLIEERLKRSIWLENVERQRGFEWKKIYFLLRPIYYEARNCYIYECYRGTISVVSSLIESFLINEIPFEDFLKKKKFLKRKDSSEVDPKKLNLSDLAKLAKKKEYISSDLYRRIDMYLPVRHNIVHYPESAVPLGFYRTSIRGSGTKSRGVSFESPGRKPILPLKLQDAAETGILIFLDLIYHFSLQKE